MRVLLQVRFLVEQGIDHLVSLSPEKIPPHYAFPNLQHTLIPVEDFTGPTIAEIQKFLEICDCARRDGEVCQDCQLFLRFYIYQIFFRPLACTARRGAAARASCARVISSTTTTWSRGTPSGSCGGRDPAAWRGRCRRRPWSGSTSC